MAKLSATERREMEEEVEYYEEHHPSEKKRGYDEASPSSDNYDEERTRFEKEKQRRETSASAFERAEYTEELEYHESLFPSRGMRRQPSYPDAPADSFELRQPGHGEMITLTPFEIGQYKEELEYHEKTQVPKRGSPPVTLAELSVIEVEWAVLGESGRMRKLPEGMLGYDIESNYFHAVSQRDNPFINPRGTSMHGAPIGPRRSYGRVIEDTIRQMGRNVEFARDQLYGYRRIYPDPNSIAWRIDPRSVRRSHIGDINFFSDRRGKSLMEMDPFHLGGGSPRKPAGKKARGRERGSTAGRNGGRVVADPFHVPESLAWMF